MTAVRKWEQSPEISDFPGDQPTDWSAYLNNAPTIDDLANLFGSDDPSGFPTPGEKKRPGPKPGSKKAKLSVVEDAWVPKNGFTALDQLRAIHPDRKDKVGYIYFVRLDDNGDFVAQWKRPLAKLEEAVAEAFKFGDTNVYFSMMPFTKRSRKSESLIALGCTFVDLDYRKKTGPIPAMSIVRNVIMELEIAKKPMPSMILSTGMGLLAIWLHELVSASAKPVWEKWQNEMGTLLEAYGADAQAKDPCRVFRLIGSKNSKARGTDHEHVEMIWGNPQDLKRYKFRELIDAVVPAKVEKEATVTSFATEHSKRVAAGSIKKESKLGKRPRLTLQSLAKTRLEDIERLMAYRYGKGGKLPSGYRDRYIFLKACQNAFLTHPDAIGNVAGGEGVKLADWNEHQGRGVVSTVVSRTKSAWAGNTTEWNGKTVDIRYGYSTERLIEILEITKEEMREAGLRTLCDDEQLAENKRIADKERRIANGQKTDHQHQRNNRASIREQAIPLRDAGLSLRKIAVQLDVPYSTLNKVMKEG